MASRQWVKARRKMTERAGKSTGRGHGRALKCRTPAKGRSLRLGGRAVRRRAFSLAHIEQGGRADAKVPCKPGLTTSDAVILPLFCRTRPPTMPAVADRAGESTEGQPPIGTIARGAPGARPIAGHVRLQLQ